MRESSAKTGKPEVLEQKALEALATGLAEQEISGQTISAHTVSDQG